MRRIEIITGKEKASAIREKLEGEGYSGFWELPAEGGGRSLALVVSSDKSADVLELLENEAGDSCQIYVYAVEASLPRLEDKKEEPEEEEEEYIQLGKFSKASKEELYEDIANSGKTSLNFILMVILSAVVAGIGILKNAEPIIIGAMVIAPFLGPNIALSFSTTIGDLSLTRQAIGTAVWATVLTLAISFLWGLLDKGVADIPHDTRVAYRDIILALACGFAGVLSVISIEASALVGVMVAAALLPPLMRAGLFLGGRMYEPALHAFLIYAINITSLNLAGIITFYAAGIRPSRWWEKERAQRHTRKAVLVLLGILALLALFIALARKSSGLI